MRSPIHRDLLASVLNVYGRSLADVVVLIGDNCPTNCYIGWGNTFGKFNKTQPGAEIAIENVNASVSKATNLTAAATLRELTDLVAIRSNDTRWSTTFHMIKGLFALESELRRVHEIEMPRQSDLYILRDLLPTLSKFDSVMVDLQRRVCLSDRLEERLTSCLRTTRSPTTTWLKTQASCRIRYSNRQSSKYWTQKVGELTGPELGTSAPVERLFSTAKYTLTDRRKRMGPILFEALFLKTKREFWDS
ncbi:hypothetical protein JG687_00001403 [Phytophthora cactorum]|uniref:HAT C-terminal dimerisation domain-containing protein n=1 Tax=Phytophthora cactorum TaxID=29920 RepID=A0A8T1UY05_9STRA|nr:hypothetical protein JG687_00001403 [Phytophthora cactorum]